MKRIGAILAALFSVLAIMVVVNPSAQASNSSTSGCTNVFIEYESINSTLRYVYWVESRNVCGPYPGHFQTYGVNDVDRNPILNHRVYINQYFNRGGCITGTGWRNDGGGNFFNMGSTCTLIA
ncbi:hypothetical protein IOD16_30780 [Saccharothrix sp. 6-C]|uniref:hypothetical protein n=1 Tax=Saccharothrix sp. 6-C TaxID=2781735 RepID=UPI00191713E6|nr:hypothetical protein [Saccharothrix sp. 6-C]QQQ75443.1 hypothetical protein IOD16_30780 [Saccharothrix sp. 6-C]